jgi:5'-3' exonuclease
MGVPYFFYQIYKKYEKEDHLSVSHIEIQKTQIDYLFFDFNSLIHPSAQKTIELLDDNFDFNNCELLEHRIIEDVILYTRYIINLLKPKHTYIMIDGVAPRGKINQQRERRYKSLLFSTHTKKWDSNKITPGTKFMEYLNKQLLIFKEIMETNDITKIYISNSLEYGEGEHKMMKIIDNIDEYNDNINSKNIFIYGLDADLIMLSLLKQQSKNKLKEHISIFLLRDNSFNQNTKEELKSNADIYFTYIKIKSLENGICNEVRGMFKNCNLSNREIITDYIFICFLLGNDFLEHIPSLIIKKNGLHFLLNCYTKTVIKYNESLININYIEDKDNWKNSIKLNLLTHLFYEIQNNEDYFLKNILNNNITFKDYNLLNELSNLQDSNNISNIIIKNIKETSDSKNEKNDNCIVYNKNTKILFNLKDTIKYNEKNYKNRYYIYYGIYDKVNDACQKYIEGLYWVLGYYNNHIHENWSWFYEYDQVPFASDIYQYLNSNRKEITLHINNTIYLNKSEKLTSIMQLLMVLPKESLYKILKEVDITIYKKIERILVTDSIEIKEFYPNELFVDLLNKEFLWQSKIFFKNIKDYFLTFF